MRLRLAWALALSCCAASCDCTDEHCDDALQVNGSLGLTGYIVFDLVVCRNEACTRTTIVTNRTATLGGEVAGLIRLWRPYSATPELAEPWRYDLTLDPDDRAGPFDDGDRLRVRFTEHTTGAVVLDIDRTVLYETLAPNGDYCGPVCERAELKVDAP